MKIEELKNDKPEDKKSEDINPEDAFINYYLGPSEDNNLLMRIGPKVYINTLFNIDIKVEKVEELASKIKEEHEKIANLIKSIPILLEKVNKLEENNLKLKNALM